MKSTITILVLSLFCKLYGEADYQWVGTTNTLDTSSNWSPSGPPPPNGGPTDHNFGIFDSASISKTPTVTLGTELNTGAFRFTDATPFTFSLGGTAGELNFSNGQGIINLGTANQVFNLSPAAIGVNYAIIFGAPAFNDTKVSADYTNSGLVTYNGSGLRGGIEFDNFGHAGSATFNMSNNAAITFLNTSTAENGIFNLSSGANVSFGSDGNPATAGSATFNASDGSISFAGTSTAANGIFNLKNGSNLGFTINAMGGNAVVNLSSGSVLTVGVNNGNPGHLSIGSLSNLDGTANISFEFNNNTLTVGSNNLSTTYAGTSNQVSFGTGSLTKVGTGTFTMSGANAYTGATTVAAGTLDLTGSVGGNFIVQPGATATGNGLVGGSYTQDANSFFLVTAPVHMTAVGDLNLNGNGEVEVGANFPYTPTPVLILHSEIPTGRNGTFASVVSFNPYYQPFLTYDPGNVYLNLATNFQRFAITPNEINVSHTLDTTTSPGTDPTTLIMNLVTLSEPAFLSALNQLSGVQYANLIQLNELGNRRFMRQIFDPFRADFACPCKTYCCGEVIGWSSIEGGQSFLRSDYNARGLNLYDVDVSVGAHRYFNSNLAVGIAGNYEYDHANFYQGGTGNANNFQGALYAMCQNKCGYLFGEVAGGYTHWNVRRPIGFASYFETARGTSEISHVALYGEGGINWWLCNYLLQPFFALEYGHYWRNHTYETGAAAASLFIHSHDVDDFESRLGLHATRTYCNIVFSADADWRYRYLGLGDSLTMNFEEFGSAFDIVGPRQDRNAFEGALYVGTPVCGNFVYLEGFGEVWNRFASYGVTLGLERSW